MAATNLPSTNSAAEVSWRNDDSPSIRIRFEIVDSRSVFEIVVSSRGSDASGSVAVSCEGWGCLQFNQQGAGARKKFQMPTLGTFQHNRPCALRDEVQARESILFQFLITSQAIDGHGYLWSRLE
jgi:hypothetical protein